MLWRLYRIVIFLYLKNVIFFKPFIFKGEKINFLMRVRGKQPFIRFYRQLYSGSSINRSIHVETVFSSLESSLRSLDSRFDFSTTRRLDARHTTQCYRIARAFISSYQNLALTQAYNQSYWCPRLMYVIEKAMRPYLVKKIFGKKVELLSLFHF